MCCRCQSEYRWVPSAGLREARLPHSRLLPLGPWSAVVCGSHPFGVVLLYFISPFVVYFCFVEPVSSSHRYSQSPAVDLCPSLRPQPRYPKPETLPVAPLQQAPHARSFTPRSFAGPLLIICSYRTSGYVDLHGFHYISQAQSAGAIPAQPPPSRSLYISASEGRALLVHPSAAPCPTLVERLR
jgi:hypothetical protein